MMKKLFEYNWQVRKEWFELCKQIGHEQLVKKRAGGLGNFIDTLSHIIVVEYDWIQDLKGKQVYDFSKDDYQTIDDVISFHERLHQEVREFVSGWTEEIGKKTLTLPNGESYNSEEVMNHIIAHEIHHMGQLSVWAREIGVTPVSANLVNRGLYES
jgi:uncharacterized damage-inducible protein DinB